MSDDDDGKYEGSEMSEEELLLIKMALDLVAKKRERREKNNVVHIERWRDKNKKNESPEER
tara:strand:+ start:2794 stop:2976 length:183 start_codon:yes stop_codon:yes gene_type:complete